MSSKRFSEGMYPWVPLDGQSSTPDTPATDTYRLFVNDDGDVVLLDDGDGETVLGGDSLPTVVPVSGNHTVVLSDGTEQILVVSAEADITIEQDSVEDFPAGALVNIVAATASTVTVVEGSGATVNKAADLTFELAGQWSEVSLLKLPTADAWFGVGGFAEDES